MFSRPIDDRLKTNDGHSQGDRIRSLIISVILWKTKLYFHFIFLIKFTEQLHGQSHSDHHLTEHSDLCLLRSLQSSSSNIYFMSSFEKNTLTNQQWYQVYMQKYMNKDHVFHCFVWHIHQADEQEQKLVHWKWARNYVTIVYHEMKVWSNDDDYAIYLDYYWRINKMNHFLKFHLLPGD